MVTNGNEKVNRVDAITARQSAARAATNDALAIRELAGRTNNQALICAATLHLDDCREAEREATAELYRRDDARTEESADGSVRGIGIAEAFVPVCRRSVRLKHNLLPLARPLRDRSGGAR